MNYLELETKLYEELSWRKKKISELFLITSQFSDKKVLYESLILLIYAHWEGFIKKASKYYLLAISKQECVISSLCTNFQGIAIKGVIRECLNEVTCKGVHTEVKLFKQYEEIKNDIFSLEININKDKDDSIIDSESNLTPKVLKKIFEVIGFNYNQVLMTKELYINKVLIENRHCIAHGSKFNEYNQIAEFQLNIEELKKLKDTIITILNYYIDEILIHFDNKFYLQANSQQKEEHNHQIENELETTLSQLC